MSRGYFENTQTPFLYSESESVDHEGVGHGVECLGGRPHQPTGPFHYLISEQAKSLVALQELQHEVGALLEFRDLVMETFPNLRSKLQQQQSASSTPATMTGHHHIHHSNIPISIRPGGDWTPGIRVRKKLGISNGKEKKNGNDSATTSAVQDSGFSTEASSKETHSASSTVPTSNSATGNSETDETEDELWNLLDIIYRKGTRLKDEVEALQGALRDQNPFGDTSGGGANFHRALFHSSADDVRQLRQERDLLLDRLAEMEAEVLAGRLHTSRLQEDLEDLLTAKQDLEEQLKAIVSQRGEVNSRIHDLHLQFVAKSASDEKLKLRVSCSDLDAVLGDRIPKVALPVDKKKIAAILKENNPIVLQKHLLVSTVQNQVLKQQLDSVGGVELGLRSQLEKAVEENEDLRFELANTTIELEGTKARVRVLEDLHKPYATKSSTSPDIIPNGDIGQEHRRPLSRTEICTASMKAMSPITMTLQIDHSSSTESAHDHAESNRNKESISKRRPSKIPLKSYTAPKPPGGKHSPAPRSRSGESPHRSHNSSSHHHYSWRNRSSSGPGGNDHSLPKSRNSSLVSARDSLKRTDSKNSSSGSPGPGQQGTLKKWNANGGGYVKDEKTQNSISSNEKSPSPWILSSYKHEPMDYPDSLMNGKSFNPDIESSELNRFHQTKTTATTKTFLWNTRNDFYDSIDSNMASSNYYCRSNGEDLAECDSLEHQLLNNISFRD
ncbi:hypothetical protein ABEB36_005357 [Hypothenemus hampei]|uniref:Uncharacterized protein n=1 Tax=Hypothenemus hampei TaxID=57062 RepID=A0ABD1F1T7_HYPHA